MPVTAPAPCLCSRTGKDCAPVCNARARTLPKLLDRKEIVHSPTRPRPRNLTHAHPLKKAMSTPHGLSRFTVHSLRSEEHTSELQSRFDLVCRLLLEKKKLGERL